MKKLFLCLAVVGMLIAGCKKEDEGCGRDCFNGGTLNTQTCTCNCPSGFIGTECEIDNRPACQKNNTGEIVFDSYSDNPYACYVDNQYKGIVPGWGVLRVTVSGGYRSLRVLQQSGYVLYPSEFTSSASVVACYEYTFEFP